MPVPWLPLPGDEESPDSTSQIAWLRSLGDHEALFQILENERRSILGLEAAEALAQLGDVRGMDHLIAILNDPGSRLRMEAAEMLQRLNHPRGLRALRASQIEVQSPDTAEERQEVYETLNTATTDELMAIWHENDRTEWSQLELAVIEEILASRLGRVPRREARPDANGEIDEEADPRVQRLWQRVETNALQRIMRENADPALQLDAAEALAALGDSTALDFLVEVLDDEDEELNQTAARILDWLDLPEGNAALRERGFEFDSETADSEEPEPAEPVLDSSEEPGDWPSVQSRPLTEVVSRTPAAGRTPSSGAWQPDGPAAGGAFGSALVGAVGGLLSFLAIRIALDMLGLQPMPAAVGEWLQPSLIYAFVQSVLVGGVYGVIAARAVPDAGTRGDGIPDEGDARAVLAAFSGGLVVSGVVGVLGFLFRN